MVGSRRSGTHKFDAFSGQQRLIHFGHGPHHQGIRIIEFSNGNRTTRNSLNLAQAAEELASVRHIFVNEDFHV
ncbi:hypothetical protein D3C78_1000450 [compost metagenome]